MSQESGIPTFRDALTGLWSRFRPEDLATESAFRENPERVFNWYLARLKTIRAAVPNAGHFALGAMESIFRSLVVVTQNVDGLHQRAGSANVLELHGSLERFRCVDCSRAFPVVDVERILPGGSSGFVKPFVCESCGGMARPGVVWFGESLPTDELGRAWAAARECDVMLVVGTSAQVYPVADLPHAALKAGAEVVEINPVLTPLSAFCACVIRDSAAASLKRLAALLTDDGKKR